MGYSCTFNPMRGREIEKFDCDHPHCILSQEFRWGIPFRWISITIGASPSDGVEEDVSYYFCSKQHAKEWLHELP